MKVNSVFEHIEGFSDVAKSIDDAEVAVTDYSAEAVDVYKVVNLYHPKRQYLKVKEIIEQTQSTKTFRFVSQDGYLAPFRSGQYINLYFDIDGVKTARPYAISSPASKRGYYDITVKRVPNGLISNYMIDNLRCGDSIESTGPMGQFHYNPLFHGKKLVFIAGGSGITPAYSMINDFVAKGKDDISFHLIYGSQSLDDIIYKDELDALANKNANVTVDYVISNPPVAYEGPKGFITAGLLAQLISDIHAQTYYLCGPQIMYDFCLKELHTLGIDKKKIRVEANGAPANPDRRSDWPEGVSLTDSVSVTVNGERSFEMAVDEPLISALEKNGINPENACRSGECSLCRVRLVSGKVYNPEESRLRRSDKTFGYIHSCVAFPVEDIEIEVK